MLLGYNTNGLAHHRLEDAVRLLAGLGYRSVAITIDHYALAPEAPDLAQQLARLRRLLAELGMRSVIETGARYLLDPLNKHEPTLVSADPDARQRRIEFYRHAIRCAAELESDCVSIWSGVLRDDASRETVLGRLVDGLRCVLDDAAGQGVAVGFEPEPGMFIDSLECFEDLLYRLGDDRLGLTFDIGHLQCQGEVPIADRISRWADWLVNVHIEDMRAGVHEHLMFGEGEIDFPPVIAAIGAVGYRGGVHVELSRHSHEGAEAARAAMEFLRRVGEANSEC